MPPIYRFVCEDCERPSELLMKHDEVAEAKCRHCGSDNVHRAFSTNVSYKIVGNNGASTTPKKFRGGRS